MIYVSYMFNDPAGTGFGSCNVRGRSENMTPDELKEVKEAIEADYRQQGKECTVVVLFWKELAA